MLSWTTCPELQIDHLCSAFSRCKSLQATLRGCQNSDSMLNGFCRQEGMAGTVLQHNTAAGEVAAAHHTCLHSRGGFAFHTCSRSRSPAPRQAIPHALHERRTVERMTPEDDPSYRRCHCYRFQS